MTFRGFILRFILTCLLAWISIVELDLPAGVVQDQIAGAAVSFRSSMLAATSTVVEL